MVNFNIWFTIHVQTCFLVGDCKVSQAKQRLPCCLVKCFPSLFPFSCFPPRVHLKIRTIKGGCCCSSKKKPTSTPTSTGTPRHTPPHKSLICQVHKERRRSFSIITQQIWKTDYAGGSDRNFIPSFGAGEIFGRILKAWKATTKQRTLGVYFFGWRVLLLSGGLQYL